MAQLVLISSRDMLSNHAGYNGRVPSDAYFAGWFNKVPKEPSEVKLFEYMVSDWHNLLSAPL